MKNQLKYLMFLFGYLMPVYFTLQAQQGNKWYFGVNAGLSFNSSPPTALLNGALNTFEGCASLSDNNGQLLFYTDGISIWNKNQQLMQNGTGLMGDPSSANAAIIIPKPGSTSIYYIFTSDAAENNNIKGYNYSEVDMSLNGGLGAVTANKNVLLYTPSTEKLTAVRHANGIDIWVVTHAWGSDTWFSYKIDCNGVSSTPVLSNAGSPYTERILFDNGNGQQLINEGSVGCLKASADGKMIATTMVDALNWELFNFDNATGVLSNALLIPKFTAYGVEFSPDSKLVYVASERWGYDSSFITQYNLSMYDSASVVNSGIKIGASLIAPPAVTGSIGALQLGPDNKIYCAVEQTAFLSVINSPNTPGISCNFVNRKTDLAGNLCRRGLPVFFPGLIANQNANFNFTVGADCSTVNFAGTTTIIGTLIFTWDFGDGTTGTGQNITHSFIPGTGIYTIKLTVTTSTNCGTANAIAIKQINLVKLTPVSIFGDTVTCGNSTVTFIDSSKVVTSTIQNWLWDFGDGTTSSAENPQHTYDGFGNYIVKLTVASAGSCNGTNASQKIISIEPRPIAGFAIPKACVKTLVVFSNSSTITAGTITKWYWTLGNAQFSTDLNPSVTYSQPNDYNIKLVVTSSTGCISDTAYKTIHVNNNPVAEFATKDGCVSQSVYFTDKSTVNPGVIIQWNWDFGNNSTSNTESPSVIYATFGKYTINLIVKSDSGCISDTAITLINIEPKPIATFSVLDGCAGKSLAIKNNSSILFGNIANYFWDFGNGNTANQQQPTISYNTSGNYIIKQVAESKNGCASDTAFENVHIESIPKPDFDFGNTCAGKAVPFTNLSTNTDGEITEWKWNFGTNDISALLEPTYTYRQYGIYTVALEATTKNGCEATISKNISIKKVDVSAGNDTIIAVNQPLQLIASGAKGYTWSPSQYLDNFVSDHPIVQIPSIQVMTYYLSGVTAEGCIGYDTINIKAYKATDIYMPNAFTPNGDGKNDVFRPILPGVKELLYFNVYNRWGQLVFSTKEIGKGWDGKFKSVDQPASGFVWMIKVITYQGIIIEKKGNFVLFRQ